MTAKQKAEELILKFREVPIEDSVMWYVGYEISKEFALIAVDEIKTSLGRLNVEILHTDYGANLTEINGEIKTNYESHVIWWNEVKHEIENL